jgi:hypothetical protein
MRKFYLAGLAAFFFMLICSIVNAQRKIGTAIPNPKKHYVPVTNSFVSGSTADCDTVDFPVPGNWVKPGFYATNWQAGGYL